MADESGAAEGIDEHIPHLWFDVIGRIVPGAFLLAGVLERVYESPVFGHLRTDLDGLKALGPGVGALAFTLGAWIAGFLLSQLSHGLFERVLRVQR